MPLPQPEPPAAREHNPPWKVKVPINLEEVDGVKIQPKHRATCHCGAVELELDLPQGLVDARRCDYSKCRRRGALPATDISTAPGFA